MGVVVFSDIYFLNLLRLFFLGDMNIAPIEKGSMRIGRNM